MGSEEQVQKFLLLNKMEFDGTSNKLKVRKAEVLLTVIEIFNLVEEFMVDREESEVHKETEAHTLSGCGDEIPSLSPQRTYPRAPVRVGASRVLGVRGEIRPPY